MWALGAMNDEVRQLARHISELEDRELEVMEALEPIDAALSAADAERAVLDQDTARLLGAIAEAERALDADIAAQADARAVVAATLPGPCSPATRSCARGSGAPVPPDCRGARAVVVTWPCPPWRSTASARRRPTP